jgi:hypothetical protein
MAKSKNTRKPKASGAPGRSGATEATKLTHRSSDVEQRWNEYWSRRRELETAIERVKLAREALDAAVEAEQSLRSAFEETKRSLKDLLDVAPADSPRSTEDTRSEGLN